MFSLLAFPIDLTTMRWPWNGFDKVLEFARRSSLHPRSLRLMVKVKSQPYKTIYLIARDRTHGIRFQNCFEFLSTLPLVAFNHYVTSTCIRKGRCIPE